VTLKHDERPVRFAFNFNSRPCIKELLDWFEAKELTAYSVSCGQSLIYNNIFPKHKDRMDKKISGLAGGSLRRSTRPTVNRRAESAHLFDRPP
jgi:hypothetical protein